MVSGVAAFAFAIVVIACSDKKPADDTTVTTSHEQKDNKKDAEFVSKAAEGGIYEVELGRLAQMRGTSGQVKDLGKMMADEHSKANEELKALAAKKNITVPTTMGNDLQKKFDMLSAKSGADFDKEYASMMVDDHETDLKLFNKQAEHGDDPELKSWASGKVPVLEHHLEMARETKDAVKD